ncbi:3-phosphoserine/phosphohydroxythreonine transaminase [Acetonema longum]|uniref:Phosphoserine aminotransferase n=1 Tax=Acetonema longum DSM 6540 TaxID=1009370 RepID=F7NFI9_9FIRM|nr:3-phosphoserine/phosphohydroxythreonine transaminase [Acetonema longum]EGO65188.1 3-phosphoserine/phosphohydroxythreonine aminotransferase [Acetonema longum DSM 6540]
MTDRIFNFNAGPAVLPLDILKQAQAELLNYRDTGMSILEISHRSKPYEVIHQEAEADMKALLGLGDNYRVLFVQGGGSLQFAMVPMNYLPAGRIADYILTGSWSEKALQEAKLLGQTHVAATTAGEGYRRIPSLQEIKLSDKPAYVHITSNNTIYGTQWREFPNFGDIPLMADMSSDMLSRPFDAKKFALIYAGAQKNLGPAGVTIVIIRKDLLDECPPTIPTMLRYDTYAKNDSMYNTPPCFSVYIVHLVLQWLRKNGGLAAMEKHNQEKAAFIYRQIDQSGGFYRGHAEPDSRSLMNITFRLPNEELEGAFVKEAVQAGLGGLKGYRTVGGIRASVYNAMSKEGCLALAAFMDEFRKKNS